MYLINFSIQEHIKIEVADQILDLHNGFDLQKYTYNVKKRELELRFIGIIGFDTSEIKVDLKIIFRKVDFLRIVEKDTQSYTDEDSWQCLSHMGFLEDTPFEWQSSEINAFDKETCMVIAFMSGIKLYVVSKTVEVELHQWISAMG